MLRRLQNFALTGIFVCFFISAMVMIVDICHDSTLNLRAMSGDFFAAMLGFMGLYLVFLVWDTRL